MLKTFVKGTQIPLMPPLLVNNQLVSDFLAKKICLIINLVSNARQ